MCGIFNVEKKNLFIVKYSETRVCFVSVWYSCILILYFVEIKTLMINTLV